MPLMWLICTALATIGCVYALCAAACLGAWRERSAWTAPEQGDGERVSILKPLCGAEPMLRENLAALARQDYGGAFEVLLGVAAADDPAVGIAAELLSERLARPYRLIIDPTTCGPNRKVANLANMAQRAKGEIIVAADSDIGVSPEYLARVIAALSAPGVGAVTCLYRGLPAAGLWSRLAAMAIDHHFLPSVVVALRLGIAAPCFGSTIALRRETLVRIGGFEAFAAYLADDYAIGAAVRRLGFAVEVPKIVVDHTCSEASFAELIAHELRWARTVRGVAPWGFAGTVATHPLAFALLALLWAPGAFSIVVTLAALACRFALQIQADRVLGRRWGRAHWGPVRDLLSFAVFLASFWPGDVAWRGRRHRLRSDGRLA
jgi:ceramide glucosyltransferase